MSLGCAGLGGAPGRARQPVAWWPGTCLLHDTSEPPAGAQAIATLIQHEAQVSGYSQLIERTRSIGRVRVLMDAYDHILFHDGPMVSGHEDHIRSQVGGNLSSQLQFIDVAQRFHSRDQIIGQHTANSQKYGCPTASFRPGYSAMCAFWFIDIPEVLADSYSHLLRIDADCILLHAGGHIDEDPAEQLRAKGIHIASYAYPSDSKIFSQGLEAFFASLAQNASHHERRWAALPPTEDGRTHIVSPYTNVMWLDLTWARSAAVRSVRAAVDASGCVSSNRWGDLVLWGATMRLLGEAAPVTVPQLSYLHMSHHGTCTGPACTLLLRQHAYAHNLYAREIKARERRLDFLYGGNPDKVTPFDTLKHMYLWDFFPP